MLVKKKYVGKKIIGLILRLLDFAMTILIGNIIAPPLSDEGLGLKGTLVSLSV